MRLAPTRRGWAVVALVAAALAMGWVFGGRSLNAVVVPGAIAMVLSGLAVWRIDRPTVDRRIPDHGHRGDRVRVHLSVETRRAVPATVVDDHSPDLSGASTFHVTTDGSAMAYDLDLDERGVHAVGGCRVVATDPLGLWRRTFDIPATDSVLVYPALRPLSHTAGVLGRFRGSTDDREHFDAVREYRPGDPLRDVNWKTSAKRQRGLFVTEFAGTGETQTVCIAVESTRGRADAVAEAAASVATYLLEQGAPVGIDSPGESLDPATGDPHRRRILSVLATFEGGTVPEVTRDAADVIVTGGSEPGATVVVGDERRPFDRLAGTRRHEVIA